MLSKCIKYVKKLCFAYFINIKYFSDKTYAKKLILIPKISASFWFLTVADYDKYCIWS